MRVASFPGPPWLRFLIACSMQKMSQGRPGNEAKVRECVCVCRGGGGRSHISSPSPPPQVPLSPNFLASTSSSIFLRELNTLCTFGKIRDQMSHPPMPSWSPSGGAWLCTILQRWDQDRTWSSREKQWPKTN